jgi:hypothetical protein
MTRARDLANIADGDITGSLTVDSITTSGNVGIGTSSPEKSLHILGSEADPLKVQRSAGGNTAIQVTDGTDTVYFGMPTGGGFAVDGDANLSTGSWFKIDSSGTVTATAFSGDGSALTGIAGFPSGTLMLFQQTAAPTGWTKQTTHNDKALRVVTGSAGSGGSVAFSTAMATPSVSGSVSISGSISNTTLSTSQMPSHNHTFSRASGNGNNSSATGRGNFNGVAQLGTSSVGGGGSHNHGHSLSGSLSSSTATINVNYVDLIIAAKD